MPREKYDAMLNFSQAEKEERKLRLAWYCADISFEEYKRQMSLVHQALLSPLLRSQ